MRFKPDRLLALLLPVAGLCLLPAGCATESTSEEAAVGVAPQPPTNPDQVAILHSEPTRPHIKLGKVTVDASTDPAPPVEKIEADLKKGAAKLGADAVVIVADRTQTMGAIVTGGDWGEWDGGYDGYDGGPTEITPIKDRVVIGVAIKYQQAGGSPGGTD